MPCSSDTLRPLTAPSKGGEGWGATVLEALAFCVCSPLCLAIAMTFSVSSNSVSTCLFGIGVQRQSRFRQQLGAAERHSSQAQTHCKTET